jgi:hypothetical protein
MEHAETGLTFDGYHLDAEQDGTEISEDVFPGTTRMVFHVSASVNHHAVRNRREWNTVLIEEI